MKIKDIKVKDIKEITLEQAYECYMTWGLGFCIKDGIIKGFYKNV